MSDAAQIAPTDPRWVVAVRVAEQLQGGQAAILAPEDRRRLVALAERLGLRAFDAALIIAIVQDAARSGLDPLSITIESSLGLVRTPEADPPVLGLVLTSLALGAAIFCGLLAWVGVL